MEKNVLKIFVVGALTMCAMASAAPGWFVNTDVNQDFRYRLQEDKSDNYVNGAPRYRERMRYRIGITSKIDDEFSVGARLSTGALNDTVSRTDTYGDNNAFGAADINLEQAYLNYAPKWVPSVAGAFKATVGKFGINTGISTVTTIAWDSNIALEGKNLNYAYKNLGVKDLNLFANVGSYVLKTETPPAKVDGTIDGGGYNNANMVVQQLGLQYKISNISFDAMYALYTLPNFDSTNYNAIGYADDKAITELGAKIGTTLSVPGFEKVAVLYDELINPNQSSDNKASAYGIEFGSKIGLPYLKDYSIRYLARSIEKDTQWAFYDDGHKTPNTQGYQATLTLGIVDNVSFGFDYFVMSGIDDTNVNGDELSDDAKDKLNTSSARFELNVKF